MDMYGYGYVWPRYKIRKEGGREGSSCGSAGYGRVRWVNTTKGGHIIQSICDSPEVEQICIVPHIPRLHPGWKNSICLV